MGIYITGMEMLKGRPVCIIIDAAGQARHYDLNNDRYADDKLFEVVSVPPHGDLIDRGALMKDFDSPYRFRTFGDVPVFHEEAIRTAPTIIPAEEDE